MFVVDVAGCGPLATRSVAADASRRIGIDLKKEVLVRKVVASEHQEQVAFFQWVNVAKKQDARLEMMFAIPNAGGFSGGFHKNVVRVVNLKREGVRSGVPDVQLAWGNLHYHALFLEMKTKNGRQSDAQIGWMQKLHSTKHAACFVYGCDQAIIVTQLYLNNRLCSYRDGTWRPL